MASATLSVPRGAGAKSVDKDMQQYLLGFIDAGARFSFKFTETHGCQLSFGVWVDERVCPEEEQVSQLLTSIQSFLGCGRIVRNNPGKYLDVSLFSDVHQTLLPFLLKHKSSLLLSRLPLLATLAASALITKHQLHKNPQGINMLRFLSRATKLKYQQGDDAFSYAQAVLDVYKRATRGGSAAAFASEGDSLAQRFNRPERPEPKIKMGAACMKGPKITDINRFSKILDQAFGPAKLTTAYYHGVIDAKANVSISLAPRPQRATGVTIGREFRVGSTATGGEVFLDALQKELGGSGVLHWYLGGHKLTVRDQDELVNTVMPYILKGRGEYPFVRSKQMRAMDTILNRLAAGDHMCDEGLKDILETYAEQGVTKMKSVRDWRAKYNV